MAEALDLSGKRFDFLIVVGLHHIEKEYDKNRDRYINKKFWLCRCECGNKIIRTTRSLTNTKHIHSCGCQLSYKARVKSNDKKQKYPNYKQIITRWSKIKERLYNPNSISYHNYGGRGIKMCKQWKDNSMAFYEWAISSGYKEGLSIDRIDNNGDYSPENCRWVDRKTQNRNTRRNVFINYNEETHCMSEWAEICGTSLRTFWKFVNDHNKDYVATIEHFKKIY